MFKGSQYIFAVTVGKKQRLQKRVQEMEELINGEKEILIKKCYGGTDVEVCGL